MFTLSFVIKFHDLYQRRGLIPYNESNNQIELFYMGDLKMARRKSKVKQEEEFFEALAGLAALSLAVLGFFITKSIYGAMVGGGLGLVIVLSIMKYIHDKRAERLKKSGIADIDRMEGVQFEKYLGYLFRAQGYQTEVTKAAGDFGADLILQKESKKSWCKANVTAAMSESRRSRKHKPQSPIIRLRRLGSYRIADIPRQPMTWPGQTE